eukprot:1007245-Pyramimonas_sp.AAC.1
MFALTHAENIDAFSDAQNVLAQMMKGPQSTLGYPLMDEILVKSIPFEGVCAYLTLKHTALAHPSACSLCCELPLRVGAHLRLRNKRSVARRPLW